MNEKIPSLAQGTANIKRHQQNMPDAPGVYRMIDAAGNTLYIGKAKNLRARVASYVNASALNTRLQNMVSQVEVMDVTTTRSEAEAFLLEANLIKKFLPRYNILLKDDKSFPYIFFSGDHSYSRISKHRGAKTKKGKYFGPFVSAHAVNDMLVLLQKAFLLRPCSDNIFKNRTRPCLQYQIKRCSAPCVGKITPEDYANLVSQAQAFLSGKNQQVRDHLTEEMQSLSLKMEYEKARVVRDRIRVINTVQQQLSVAASTIGNADVIALARDAGSACIILFSVRGGRNYGSKTWFPAHTTTYTDEEILTSFIGQFYQAQPIPNLILVSHVLKESALLEDALRMNTDYKVDIAYPLRGDKREFVDMAAKNAAEALQRHISIHVSQREVLQKVQSLFGLDEMPKRIEVYDNSHISGTNAVGAMIVAGAEGFMKAEYRKFNIKQSEIVPGDDYGMLREVLTRRFSKLQEESEDSAKIPDLVLIDGGAGQLSVATKVFEELGISDIPYVAISKGEDRNAGREFFHMVGKEAFQLPHESPVLHFLQRIRDEAHRFAIGTHRSKRAKSMQVSELDAIPFIGPHRKKALLQHFGSVRELSGASITEIEKVEGISKSIARQIYEHFHGEV
ncbi:MAG: excinuclease ABC subunit UvrC [Alphaproteobacteria bacterium]